jgi:methyl-accepting chemotaxis protein
LLADAYGLSLDPDADIYQLIQAVMYSLPALTEELGKSRGKGAGMLAAHSASVADKQALGVYVAMVDESLSTMERAFDKAVAHKPELKKLLEQPMKEAREQAKLANDLAKAEILNAEQLSYPSPDYFALVTKAVGAQGKVYETAMTALDSLLVERVAAKQRQMVLVLGALALLALAGSVLGLVAARSITSQLGGEPAEVVGIGNAVANGDLSTAIHVQPGSEDSIKGAMARMQDALRQTVAAVRQGAEMVATSSSEIASGNHDLSARTESQASALEQTAASMEELGSTVRQNADNARQANQLAMNASEVAIKGGEVVGQVVETMKGINQASHRIADIIGVIDGIAFQTNILALNAAVEAARAGEQGRGFAVVASEVRNLAGRSAEAAKEIKALIGASVERVEHGSTLVDQAGATMTEVVAAIRRVTDIMGEISAASSEQSAGVAQVGEAVTQMDHATQQNAALVEEMAAAASSLQGQAQDLVHTVAVFRLNAEDAHDINLQGVQQSSPQAAATSFAASDSGGIGINLNNAIKAHADWRNKLRKALIHKEQLDAETIGRDNCCELGKWLHGAGKSQYGGKPSFVKLVDAHRAFHEEAGRVAQEVNSGRYELANKMLENTAAGFTKASNTVKSFIVQLTRELAM